MKKLLIIMVVLLCGFTAKCKVFKVDNIYYQINENTDNPTVSVCNRNGCVEEWYVERGVDCYPWHCGATSEYTGDIVIPSKVSYEGREYTVTRVGVAAFANCTELKSVKLPSTVERVCEGAFFDCSGLETFEFAGKIRGIGHYTLYGCSSLTRLDLNGVQDYVYVNLWQSPNLREVVLPYDACIYGIFGDNKECNFYIKNPIPPYPQVYYFEAVGEGSVLYVPEDSFIEGWSTYEACEIYRNAFKNIRAMDFSSVSTVNAGESEYSLQGDVLGAPAGKTVEVYDVKGRLVDVVAVGGSRKLNGGVYVVRCGTVSEKIVVK